MEIFIAIVLLIAGIALCVKGSDFFVDASSWLGEVSGISKAVIGATIVAFSTSAPEIFTSLFAAMRGMEEMAVADIVGTNAVNIGIGIALIAIIRPGPVNDKLFIMRGILMTLVGVMLLVFALIGFISWIMGVAFLVVLIVFTFLNIKHCKEEKVPRRKTNRKETIINTIKFIVGLAGVLGGAYMVVEGASTLALTWGMSERLVGITIVAIGTSLPEIATCVAGVVKKECNMAIGNIVGSFVFNITAVFALIAFATGGIAIEPIMAYFAIPAILGLALLVFIPTAIGKRTYRWQGIVIAISYLAFLGFMIFL